MSTQFNAYTRSFEIIFTPRSSLYSHLLQSSQQNLRWVNSTTSNNPLLIITPFHESEIQAAVLCSKNQGLQVRVRSGGHDYEGLSYLSQTPFIIIDLMNFRSIEVDIADETAWLQSGATLGELYYAIGKETDNVIDAFLIDVNGRILDREAMGEELFWAIRGGGGASFGVILSWKIKLVKVPPTVIVFTVSKTIEQGATKLVHRWQYIADKLHEDLFIRIIIQNVGGDAEPIPEGVFRGIWKRFLEEELVFMIMDPYGGKMNDILESEIPFPHRKGNLYNIQYLVKWEVNGVGKSNKHVRWIRMLHRYMTPYASKSPRSAYLNYRDLDLGSNKDINTSYLEASVWGVKYFKGNFKRLVQVKSKIDPHNFFRNEQSIPSLHE
ncbi:hypothetical protein GH714_016896 [Hevea brasiliensis]|uniref:FAD-binding PCMH-type domain-containing protein n=1 Tax=Hevea brasiliensis TaxID=3981 RepID=A0A6A6MAL2_HEVBR|nr:hypothetical protein GH714_016896 [Hevea brasiliensis]